VNVAYGRRLSGVDALLAAPVLVNGCGNPVCQRIDAADVRASSHVLNRREWGCPAAYRRQSAAEGALAYVEFSMSWSEHGVAAVHHEHRTGDERRS
jgi:hypothetical protein